MKSIFVGNLSVSVTEAVLGSLFEAYGTVERVSIVTDRETGQAKGFGLSRFTVSHNADSLNCSVGFKKRTENRFRDGNAQVSNKYAFHVLKVFPVVAMVIRFQRRSGRFRLCLGTAPSQERPYRLSEMSALENCRVIVGCGIAAYFSVLSGKRHQGRTARQIGRAHV